MASSAILSTVVIAAILTSTKGYTIGSFQSTSDGLRPSEFLTPPPFFKSSLQTTQSFGNYKDGPIVGHPKVPPINARESGGREDDLLPPFEPVQFVSNTRSQSFRRSTEDVKVDPKTGYPLEAEPTWKDAGGTGDILELPLEDSSKTEKDGVDPKTGYPYQAEPDWKLAGGDGDILEPPLEDPSDSSNPSPGDQTAVDPKTGYPLVAQPDWFLAGGDGTILDLPLEEPNEQPADTKEEVDPKTGYPLKAQPGWKDAGGNEEILDLPLEDTQDSVAQTKEEVDPKTGYPLKAQPSWKDAGGDGDILQLPLEEQNGNAGDAQQKVDPKTGYPLVAEPSWKDAGGNEDILQLPLEDSRENFVSSIESRTGLLPDTEIIDLLPPPKEQSFPPTFINTVTPPSLFTTIRSRQSQTFPATFFNNNINHSNQRRDSFSNQQPLPFGIVQGKPVESSYTYTGPDNVVVTVTRYLNTDKQQTSMPVTPTIGQNAFSQRRLTLLNSYNHEPFNFFNFSQIRR